MWTPDLLHKRVQTIRDWWNERIAEGCQLEFISDTLEDIDWQGENEWKKWVALHTLHADFSRSKKLVMPLNQFSLNFVKATGERRRHWRKVKVDFAPGLTGIKRVKVLQFGPPPCVPLPI